MSEDITAGAAEELETQNGVDATASDEASSASDENVTADPDDGADTDADAGSAEDTDAAHTSEPADEAGSQGPTPSPDDSDSSDGQTRQKPSRSELLEEEGEIAADYLEELLDIADIDGDIDIDVADSRAEVAIVCEDEDSNLSTLVGKQGRTLSALQELTRLAVQTATGQRSWLMLDIDGYRDQRKEDVRDIARRGIERVKDTGESYECQPMNSFERKVVHDEVAKAGLYSESAGEGDRRRVVIQSA